MAGGLLVLVTLIVSGFSVLRELWGPNSYSLLNDSRTENKEVRADPAEYEFVLDAFKHKMTGVESKRWFNTGLAVKKGDRIRGSAEGNIEIGALWIEVNASGYSGSEKGYCTTDANKRGGLGRLYFGVADDEESYVRDRTASVNR